MTVRVSMGLGPTRLALALGLTAAVSGCARDRELDWSFAFADRETATLARTVTIEVRLGGCEGLVAWSAEMAAVDGRPSDPPSLGPGTYGFHGLALEEACGVVAEGCMAFTLPLEDGAQVEIPLETRAVISNPICAPCAQGFCGSPPEAR